MALKRYAQVGTGGRARMYYEAVASKYSKIACMVGFCDQSQTRMNYANSRLEELGAKKVPTYLPHEFEKMIQETKPDVVLLVVRLWPLAVTRAWPLVSRAVAWMLSMGSCP